MSDFEVQSPSARFTAVVVDIAPGYGSRPVQDALSDLILHLLERGYQIFLCVTTDPSRLQGESFEHPAITYLRDGGPPTAETLAKYPELRAATTLWVTDDAQLQAWIRQEGLPFAFPAQRLLSFAPSLALTGYSELATLLDPTTTTLHDVATFLGEHRHEKRAGALLVGIGGPPASGFERFAVQLKRDVEAEITPLVELLDLAAFLRTSDEALTAPDGGPWRNAAAGQWVMETVLTPLAAGHRVYLETRPPAVPRDFEAHFPLFLSEESIVLVLGELLFAPPVRDCLDISILLEVSPRETTRRLYEIADGQAFHEKFVQQYLAGQGGRYRDYLERHQVVQHSTLSIDANRALALSIRPRANA